MAGDTAIIEMHFFKKREVSFQEAATVYGDPLAITFQDPDHSEDEERQIIFGLSLPKRLIVVFLCNKIDLLQSADTPVLLQEHPGAPDLSH